MAFDKKHYKEIKKWVLLSLKEYHYDPTIFLPVIAACLKDEDFEAAQATSDAIRQWFEEQGETIPPEATLKIPDTCEDPEGYIICLGNPDDPSGMKSGGALWG